MIVDTGRRRLAEMITAINSVNNQTNSFKWIRVGDGGSATSMNETTLNSQVGNAISVTPSLAGNTLLYEIEIDGSTISANQISELGIFDAEEDGVMLCRVNFNPVGPLTSGETLTFHFRLEIE